jgi:hypothetical protein
MYDALIAFDRADKSGHYREHVSIDGLRSLCGLDIDHWVRMPKGSVRCLRCSRAAALARRKPASFLPGPSVTVPALVEFLTEALTETSETECARRVSLLHGVDEEALGHRLMTLQETARTLPARRLLALTVQVIKRRRTARDLQALRQALVYGD